MTSQPDKPSKGIERRGFLKLSAGSAAVAAVGTGLLAGGTTPASAKMTGRTNRAADLPAATGPRCVVIGGGVSGLTMARALKKANPKFDVVMVEPNATYFSCVLSNLWLADLIDLKTLVHSFCDAAKDGNYTWLQGKLIDLDRDAKRAYTSEGYIDYKYIVIAPGIDYNFASVGIKDPAMAAICAQSYPAAFKPGSEHLTLKKKLEGFEGGTFVMTVPTGNYRCLPGPYERACMVASYFQKNKIKGKIILLDPGEKPFAPMATGFLTAFSDLYKDVIEYKPSTDVKSVDPIKKTVTTEFDTIKFEDASIYPRNRASKIIEELGLHDPKSPQLEADINPYTYACKGDNHCYVTGDARPMGMSKSANTSNTEAHYVARLIAAREAGKEIEWESPTTLCFAPTNANPEQAIMVQAHYKKDGFGFTDVTLDNNRSEANAKAGREWFKGLIRDFI